jgi:hypothetical protein
VVFGAAWGGNLSEGVKTRDVDSEFDSQVLESVIVLFGRTFKASQNVKHWEFEVSLQAIRPCWTLRNAAA